MLYLNYFFIINKFSAEKNFICCFWQIFPLVSAKKEMKAYYAEVQQRLPHLRKISYWFLFRGWKLHVINIEIRNIKEVKIEIRVLNERVAVGAGNEEDCFTMQITNINNRVNGVKPRVRWKGWAWLLFTGGNRLGALSY